MSDVTLSHTSAEWAPLVKCTHTQSYTRGRTGRQTHGISPHDEVELRPRQHENAEQRGDSAVNHRGKHVLQGHRRTLVSVANRCQEALRRRGGGGGEEK